MGWKYSNTSVETTLSGSINNSTTSLSVASVSGFPSTFPYTLILDFGESTVEVVNVTAAVGTSLTVTRGQDGTSGQSHDAGARVVHGLVARDAREPQDHIDASGNVHGVGGSSNVVGTATSQTLTNKTIDGGSNTLTALPASALSGTWGTGIVTNLTSTTATVTTVNATDVNVSDDLAVADDATIGGDLSVTGGVAASSATVSGAATVVRGSASADAFLGQVSGDTIARARIGADGKIEMGAGGVTARDTNLYRSAADTLKTDDSLVVALNADVDGNLNVDGTATVDDGLTVTGPTKVQPAVCIVTRATAHSLLGGSAASAVTFTAEEIDTDSMWSAGTEVEIPFTGVWHLSGSGIWEAEASPDGSRGVCIFKNGVVLVEQKAGVGDVTNVMPSSVSTTRLLQAGDTIQLRPFHTENTTLDWTSSVLSVVNVYAS